MANRLTYLEIPATDPQRSARFYEAICGWKIEQRSERDFRLSDDSAHLIGRWLPDRGSAGDTGLFPFYSVDDVRAAIARVAEYGGTVVEPPRLEGDTLIARLRDPAGNALGIWQFER